MIYDYKEIVPFLLDWFDYNARILAWRENPKPYYVWVSEIMLQQTRVEAVKGYFDRFIASLPDIKSLAEVDEEKLLKLWEGLGYYNRVRNLQKAARLVMSEYDGELPADYEKLLKLPGIGTYTAGAIASIAFGLPVPVVDGNVLRVTKRISGSFDDITKESVKKELWQDLIRVVPKDRPGDFNQSLMELGATVCLPNGKPLCEKCLVMHLCKAFHEDMVMKIPVKAVKKERRKEDRTILLFEYQGKYAISKRAGKGLLAGMWELPGLEGKLSENMLLQRLQELKIATDKIAPLGEAKHIFSHVEWHMIGYHILLNKKEVAHMEHSNLVWADKEEISNRYSIPNAFSVYIKPLKESGN
jgi:A/G-specific adenine glycosylase